MKKYKNALLSTTMFSFLGVHTLEDITLLTIGRFAPVPWFVMYPLGLILSWLVLGFLLEKMGKDTHKH
jgi:hypothetical protein